MATAWQSPFFSFSLRSFCGGSSLVLFILRRDKWVARKYTFFLVAPSFFTSLPLRSYTPAPRDVCWDYECWYIGNAPLLLLADLDATVERGQMLELGFPLLCVLRSKKSEEVPNVSSGSGARELYFLPLLPLTPRSFRDQLTLSNVENYR